MKHVDNVSCMRTKDPAKDAARAARVKAMRDALGLTQEALGALGGITRTVMVDIESTKNKAGSLRIRKGLATAFGLSLDETNAYLEGHMPLDEALRLRGQPRPAEPSQPRLMDLLGDRWGPTVEEARRVSGIERAVFDRIGAASQLFEIPIRGVTSFVLIKFAEAILRGEQAASEDDAPAVRRGA